MAAGAVLKTLKSVVHRLLCTGVAAAVLLAPAAKATDTQVQSWVTTASASLDERARKALDQIHGPNRRLLALRAYLRAGDTLPERWSWSQQQLSQYESTPEGKAAAADIEAVCASFALENPGFELRVNRLPRSFDLQLAHWNGNKGVAQVADSLMRSMERQFPDSGHSPAPERLRQALLDWTPQVAAPLAAPGLSPHGQGRAFDFEVVRDGTVIASLNVASARSQWDAAGWTRKLQRAVTASGRPFIGPLQSPYEPWHYAYAPRR